MNIIYTSQFKKDYKRLLKQGENPEKLKNVIEKLVDGEKLAEMFETIQMGLTPKTVYEVDNSFFQPFLS